MRKRIWLTLRWFGWLFCEAAFRAPHWLNIPPAGWSYRLGCWFYSQEYNYALRHRFYKINPRWREPDEPKFIDAI